MYRKKNCGLTLIELVIAISLLGMVVLSALAINMSSERFLRRQNVESQITNLASVALEQIIKDITLSFGNPPGTGGPAFDILLPPGSAPAGNQLNLRRFDVAPDGASANDRWVGYQFNNNSIEFNSNVLGGGSWVTLIGHVPNPINPIFQEIDTNLIRVEITCRQDPAQPQSIANPQVTIVSAAHISSAASN
jgi:prepilin-type N-terminal cleavage/methylation domain-containing protein